VIDPNARILICCRHDDTGRGGDQATAHFCAVAGGWLHAGGLAPRGLLP
jgi:hypothetical protein